MRCLFFKMIKLMQLNLKSQRRHRVGEKYKYIKKHFFPGNKFEEQNDLFSLVKVTSRLSFNQKYGKPARKMTATMNSRIMNIKPLSLGCRLPFLLETTPNTILL